MTKPPTDLRSPSLRARENRAEKERAHLAPVPVDADQDADDIDARLERDEWEANQDDAH